MQNKIDFIDILNKQYHDNKFSHAFLLETNNQDNCIKKLKQIIKIINCNNEYKENCNECNLCHLIDTFQLPNLILVEPEGQVIKKEQILNLKNTFLTKPIFSKKNIYIIKHAELLNSASANTMLKFLEEPEENIIGFFITDNKENVIDTIKSRCQIISAYEDKMENNIENEYNDIAISFVEQIEKNRHKALMYIKNELILKVENINDCKLLFQSILNIYQNLYLWKINKTKLEEKIEFLKNKKLVEIIKNMNIIIKLLEQLQYNVNFQLVLERFVIESW